MKDAYYFPHDSNAQYDEKISLLRMEHGWMGYGLYWAIIEKLRDATKYQWSSNAEAGLKHCLSDAQSSVEQISAVLETLKKVDLLSVSEDGFLYSKSLKRRMERLDSRREKLSNAGKIGGKSRKTGGLSDDKATIKPPLSDDKATIKQTKHIITKHIRSQHTIKDKLLVMIVCNSSLYRLFIITYRLCNTHSLIFSTPISSRINNGTVQYLSIAEYSDSPG